MSQPAVFLYLAVLGLIGGLLSERARASGVAALILPIVPAAAFWMALGGS